MNGPGLTPDLTPDSPLAAFLRARLDEDEAVAKGLHGATRFMGGEPDFYGQGGPAASAFWQHFTAWRALREVAAKRAILGAYESQRAARFNDPAVVDELRDVTQTLASVYRNHPDYREDWKP